MARTSVSLSCGAAGAGAGAGAGRRVLGRPILGRDQAQGCEERQGRQLLRGLSWFISCMARGDRGVTVDALMHLTDYVNPAST